MNQYGKLIWAIAGAVIFAEQAAFSDHHFSSAEVIGFFIAAVNAAVVWGATDTTLAPWGKSALGGLVAALLIAQVAITDGFQLNEWWAIGVAFLQGAGIIIDPRRPVHTVAQATQ